MTLIEFNNKFLMIKNSLEKFAYCLTADKENAKELLQDTFLTSLKNRNSFVNKSSFKAWTFTIMKDIFLHKYNTLKNNAQVQTMKSFFSDEANVFFDSNRPHPANFLLEPIEPVNDEFRVIFKMHLDGYKYMEIADELNIKPGTVKSRIFFTRKALMDQLNN